MNELKVGFENTPDDQLHTFGLAVHTALSTGDGAVHFANVSPTAAAVLTAAQAFGSALALEDSPSATVTRRARRAELINVLQRVAASCELIADGNREKLAFSGFEFRKTPVQTDLPPAKPENLRLKAGPLSGGIVAKVSPVDRAESYELQTTSDPVDGPWSSATPQTNSQKLEKTGLTPLTRAYARVRAISSNGPGEWSDIAEVVVL
jgi:hypothetical protein